MKTALMFLFLSGVVLGQISNVPTKIDTTHGIFIIDTTKFKYSGTTYKGNPIMLSSALHIGGSLFFIKDGRLEITYNKDIKPSESVKQFFEWVKKYVEGEYYLIKRKDLDKLMEAK